MRKSSFYTWYSVALAGLVMLLAPLFIQPVNGQDLSPVINQGKIDSDILGIWENPRKGWRLVIQPESVTLYNYTQSLCFKDDMPTEALTSLLRFYYREDEQLVVSLRDSNSTRYYFNALEVLPAYCISELKPTQTQVFNYFSEVMTDYYPFFDLHGVNWDALQKTYRDQITSNTSDEALFEILSTMLSDIKDGHIALEGQVGDEYKRFAPTRTRTLGPTLDELYHKQRKIRGLGAFHTDWFQRNMKAVRKKVLKRKGQGSAADESVVWGKIGNIGYIKILGMEGFSQTDGFSLEEEKAGINAIIALAIGELANTKALILDIAFNRGGLDEVSLAIASHFTDQRRLVYTKAPHRSEQEPQAIYIEPANSALYLKPVALVTSQISVSAAEIFTMAMRTIPSVTHYGEATFGALSDILSKPLPNGWQLGISNERYEDAEGEFWESRGIPPHKPIELFNPDNIYNSYPNALIALAKGL